MQERGLCVKSHFGDFVVRPIKATDNPADVGPVNLVLFTVKGYDIEDAARAIQPLIQAGTTVLTLQNGVDIPQRTGKVVGMDHIMAGVTYVYSTVEAPAVIHQTSSFHRIVFGQLDHKRTDTADSVLEVLKRSGASVELTDDIHKELWGKFIFMGAMSGIASVVRLSTGDLRSVPEARSLLLESMREIEAVAHALKVNLDLHVVEQKLTLIDSLDPSSIPSMERDVIAGRRFELESLVGITVRLGEELGVPTPVNRFVYGVLKPSLIRGESGTLSRA
jgi:2-dehydropantoate 2-reductase